MHFMWFSSAMHWSIWTDSTNNEMFFLHFRTNGVGIVWFTLFSKNAFWRWLFLMCIPPWWYHASGLFITQHHKIWHVSQSYELSIEEMSSKQGAKHIIANNYSSDNRTPDYNLPDNPPESVLFTQHDQSQM